MQIVNLTPHALNFIGGDGKIILTVEPSGALARVTAKTVTTGSVEIGVGVCIPVTGTDYGEVIGLPAPRKNTIFVVSSLVAQRCRDRDDVFIPNESVRDEKGRIIGCRSLGRV